MADRRLLDVSAWARGGHPAVREHWQELVDSDLLLCHPVFAIELLHNAINPRDYERLRADLDDAFEWIWPDGTTAEIAVRIQRRMATSAPSGQRVRTPDILIAALAAQHQLGVLHYDADYDAILARGGESFASEWLAPRSSLEDVQEKQVSLRKRFGKAFGERMRQLDDDRDLEVWPDLIALIDEQLRQRGIDPPPPP